MTGRPRLLLLDGYSVAYRAFYALPVESFSTTGGRPTNMVYGFAGTLANALRDERPTHVAVAFDVGRTTFRTEAYPEYKAGRSRSPEGFTEQLGPLGELLAAMRVPAVRVPGYEADDVIATLTTAARADGLDVLVVTGDRDALQLVADEVTVLYYYRTASSMIRYTPALVREKYGLTPAQYADFAALRGDPSDNLPGIPGIGEKTAARWIREHGSLAALVERSGEVPGKAGERLRAALDTVLLNRRLTELVRDVDVPVGIADLRRRPYDLAALARLLDELEFRNPSLRKRLFAADPGEGRPAPPETAPGPAAGAAPGTAPAAGDRAAGTAGDAAAGAADQRAGAAAGVGEETGRGAVGGGLEVGAGAAGRELGPGELTDWLRERAGGLVAVETDHTWLRGAGEITRFALAAGTGAASTAVFRPDALTGTDREAFAAWLAAPDRPKAVHDLKALLRVLPGHDLGLAGVETDTALAAYLLMPGLAAYGVADLAARHLGRRPAGEGAAGAAGRAAAVLELAGTFAGDLAETGLDAVLREVELPLSALLARVERTGIHVDAEALRDLERRFSAGMERAADEAARIAGRPSTPAPPSSSRRSCSGSWTCPAPRRSSPGTPPTWTR